MEYVFTLVVPLIAVVVIYIICKQIASHTFVCKHCAKEFTIKWYQVLVSEHSSNDYKLVCPYCKSKSWCEKVLK